MADPLTTPILRTAVNKPGTVYEAENTKRMFAEDWNAAGDALDNHEERIVELSNLLNGSSENVGMVLAPDLSADGKFSGIVEAGVAGSALAFGELVYFNNDDSRWEKVDANLSDGYDKKLGIVVVAAEADGDSTTILLYGKIRADALFPTLTIGAPVYMSETAGEIVTAQPETADAAIRIVGFGNTANELFFCPSPDYMTHI